MSFRIVRGHVHNHANTADLIVLLGAYRQRPGCRGAPDKFDDLAPLHLHAPSLQLSYRLKAELGKGRLNVRFGSKADICSATAHVRFTPNSDRESGHRQTVMSALPPKADMCGARGNVRFGPKADID